jgi:hypothetical protein
LHSPSSDLFIASDFDDTLVSRNTAKLFIEHYLLSKDPLLDRMSMGFALATRRLRGIHMASYYQLITRIPAAERRGLLRCAHINPVWLARIQELRFAHRANTVHVTLISRNCVDIISQWVMLNEAVLKRHHVVIDGIIANKPLDDGKDEYVRELADLHHFRHAGNGQLHLLGKAQFASRYPAYLGDKGEEALRDKVEEFIRV